MWGTDFPHIEGTWPWTSESLRWAFTDVPDGELELMLWEKATRCYDFDVAALRRVADRVGPTYAEIRGPAEVPTDEGAELSYAFRSVGPWSQVRPARRSRAGSVHAAGRTAPCSRRDRA